MMVATNWVMAVAGIASALLGMVLTSGIIRRSQPYFARQQAALGAVDDQVEEVMGGLDVVKVCNGEDGERERFGRSNATLEDAAWKSAFLSGTMMPLMIFVGSLSYVVVCIVGGLLALSGAIPFGTVVAFMIYIRLFTQPLQNISQAASSVQTMAAACERVFDFLEEDEMDDESAKPARIESPRGEVDFRHVRFGYEEGTDIIRDFSAKALAGKKVAIVGPTGAGKTTLVNLLMRFYEVGNGGIYIDGVNIADVTRENLHEQFGMVLQDTWFFQGTLRENIAFDAEGVGDERLDEVCEACGLLKWVRSLPAGYDTELEPGSVSAGQRHGQGRPAAHPRRGHELGRHPYRAARPARDGRPHGGAHELRHRAPALDDPRRRPHPRDGARRRGGVRQPRGAARRRRRVRQALQLAV